MRLIAFAFVLLMAPGAFAWNKPGHMVIGAIAYDQLVKDNPKLAATLADVLRQSGLFDSKIADVPAAEQDRTLFMFAARWPDDIRKSPTYTRPKWHYIDKPYVPAGDSTAAPEPDNDNALKAFADNLDKVGYLTDAKSKAIALAWVLHVGGDLHQPLHCISEYSTTYPQGDRGGNSQFVRAEAGKRVLDLHSIWDGLILGSNSDREAGNMATKLDGRDDLAKAKMPAAGDLNPKHWADESFKLAVKHAYLDGKLQSSADRHDGPVLPDGYLTTAKDIAEHQVALAGYRLAATLEGIKKVAPIGGKVATPATTEPGEKDDGRN